MHTILSYCKSHIYDLHAILVGTITFLAMFWIKRPIKKMIRKRVIRKQGTGDEDDIRLKQMIYRKNSVLILLVMILAFLLFDFAAIISPFITFSIPSAFMSGAVALAEYAFFEQLCIRERWK